MPKEAVTAQTSAPAGWCGKTCPELSAQTKERTSGQSSKKPSKSSVRKLPLFLSLNTDGQQPDASLMWEENGALRGEFSMPSFGECPSVESASHLSAILEASPPPKYSLSAKACLGILRRAERRGKPLPLILKLALEAQAQCCASPSTIRLPVTTEEGHHDTTTVPETALVSEQTGTQVQLSPLEITTPFSLPVENHPQDCRVKISENGIVQTLSGKMGTGGGNVPLTLQATLLRMREGCTGGGKGPLIQIEKSGTLCPNNGQILFTMQEFGKYAMKSAASTIKANIHKSTSDLVVETGGFLPMAGGKAGGTGYRAEQAPTLMAEQKIAVIDAECIVRRLTPLECERLQGYPDGWTDIGEWTDSNGKAHKEADSPRYKALGNSIALPPWAWVLTRLSLCAAHEPTMASLFDGIGGFPLIWEWLNAKGSCLWASEIEEFPIAVTKHHFPEEAST